MELNEAIAVFDKSADRTRPNAQTEAWKVIRAALNPDPKHGAMVDDAMIVRAWHKARNAWMAASRHGTKENADTAAIAVLEATLNAEQAVGDGWRPIDEAPEGEWVLAAIERPGYSGIAVARKISGQWEHRYGGTFGGWTHYQPLPAPPPAAIRFTNVGASEAPATKGGG